jgi:hypothetical protein
VFASLLAQILNAGYPTRKQSGANDYKSIKFEVVMSGRIG